MAKKSENRLIDVYKRQKEEGGKSEGKKTAKIIDVDLTDEEYAFGVDKKQPERCV